VKNLSKVYLIISYGFLRIESAANVQQRPVTVVQF